MRIGSRLTPKLVAGEAGTNNETEISYGRLRWQTHSTQFPNGAVGFIAWLGDFGLGFIRRPRNWDGHLLQAAIGYRAQEMP
jgi:hypothetical protein